jgi:hypothetical protein
MDLFTQMQQRDQQQSVDNNIQQRSENAPYNFRFSAMDNIPSHYQLAFTLR